MTSVARVGVFGGTFDPPHLGHLIVASDLRYALSLDQLLFVPAGRPPHKNADIVSDDEDRLTMLQLAIAGEPAFSISTADIERTGPSYTADLVEILAEEWAPADIVFLMGSDSLRDLPTWHEPGRIVRSARLGVARRPGVIVDIESVYEQIPFARGRVALVDSPLIGISSTELRARVAARTPITYQVPLAVEEYINERGLYRSR
jgi:nicotinate-nucleotide adenylyltransferase